MSEAAVEAPVESAPVVESGVEAPVEPAAPVAPSYNPYEDERVLELVDSRAAAIADQQIQALIARAQAEAAQGQGQQQVTPQSFTDEFGNFDPAAFQAYQQARDEQMFRALDERFNRIAQPLQAREQAETVAEGEQRLKDILADDIARNGDFPRDPDSKESKAEKLVRPLADAIFPSLQARFGGGPRAAEMAVAQAASLVRDIVAEARAHALNAENNRIAGIAGARPELSAAGAVGVETFDGKPLSARELAEKYSRKAAAIRG